MLFQIHAKTGKIHKIQFETRAGCKKAGPIYNSYSTTIITISYIQWATTGSVIETSSMVLCTWALGNIESC
jgi:hypothetical protein